MVYDTGFTLQDLVHIERFGDRAIPWLLKQWPVFVFFVILLNTAWWVLKAFKSQPPVTEVVHDIGQNDGFFTWDNWKNQVGMYNFKLNWYSNYFQLGSYKIMGDFLVSECIAHTHRLEPRLTGFTNKNCKGSPGPYHHKSIYVSIIWYIHILYHIISYYIVYIYI